MIQNDNDGSEKLLIRGQRNLASWECLAPEPLKTFDSSLHNEKLLVA